MKRILRENVGWKLFSLVLAVALWFGVASEPELTRFVSVPVEYKNLPEDLEISSEVVDAVYLEMRGPSSTLRELGNSASVMLDMSNVRQGEQTFTIGKDNVQLPRAVHLLRAIPAQLRFDFERRVTRQVPVRVRFAGTPPEGYEVVSYQVIPSSLAVVGPDSRVSQITGITTDPVDLSTVVGSTEFRVNSYVNDMHIRFQDQPLVAVKVVVRRK